MASDAANEKQVPPLRLLSLRFGRDDRVISSSVRAVLR